MKSTSLQLRKSYISALSNILYGAVRIPVFEEYVQETTSNKIATVTVGNMPIQCYVVILNQTTNEDAVKCIRHDRASIQLQITTVWPLNKGGSKLAEEISEKIFDIIFTPSNLNANIVLPNPFSMSVAELISQPNLSYHTETNSVWIKQLLLSHSITQS